MYKKIIAIAALSLGFIGCGANAQMNEFDIPNQTGKTISCDKIIHKQVIDICYNYKAKGANFVKYTIYGDKVNKKNIVKRPRFYAEKTIPVKYRTKPADYTYSTSSKDNTVRFDRGHLAPDADFDYDTKILRKVYTMANIIPQVSVVNQKTWTKVERYERLLATKYGKLNVITGVDYLDQDNYLVKRPLSMIEKSAKWKRNKIQKYKKQAIALEKKHILIPTGFWKILEAPTGEKQCFYYKNIKIDYKKDKLKEHKIDCSILPNPSF